MLILGHVIVREAIVSEDYGNLIEPTGCGIYIVPTTPAQAKSKQRIKMVRQERDNSELGRQSPGTRRLLRLSGSPVLSRATAAKTAMVARNAGSGYRAKCSCPSRAAVGSNLVGRIGTNVLELPSQPTLAAKRG